MLTSFKPFAKGPLQVSIAEVFLFFYNQRFKSLKFRKNVLESETPSLAVNKRRNMNG